MNNWIGAAPLDQVTSENRAATPSGSNRCERMQHTHGKSKAGVVNGKNLASVGTRQQGGHGSSYLINEVDLSASSTAPHLCRSSGGS